MLGANMGLLLYGDVSMMHVMQMDIKVVFVVVVVFC